MTTKLSIGKLATAKDALLVEFPSAGEMLRYVDGLPAQRRYADRMRNDESFFGGVQWHQLERYVTEGDKALADRSKALLAKIKGAAPATFKRIRTNKPFGRAVTGAYLSSDPMPCRSSVKVKSDTAPLTIAVNVTSSTMTRETDLEKRGLAIAALIQKLAPLRPVRLVLVGLTQYKPARPVVWTCEFPTHPVDAYRLAWLLSSQAFARGMGFACCYSAPELSKRVNATSKESGETGHWVKDQAYSNNRGPNTLGGDLSKHWRGEVFYIPAAGSDSADYYKMLNNPVEWINENVTALSK